jgi:hypothetical protein
MLDDLVFIKDPQSLSPLHSITNTTLKFSTTVNLRTFKFFSWKTGKQCICFFKKKRKEKKNSSYKYTGGAYNIFSFG